MERFDRFALAFIIGGSIVTASAVTAATAWHPPAATDRALTQHASKAQLAAARTEAHPLHQTLVIATPDMLGTDDRPAYVPSALVLPADSNVAITVVNFDDATALPAESAQFATATGVVGPLQVQALDPTNPNDTSGPATTTTAMDPATGVSHTFTISKFGINVPIAPKSRTTFTIHTGKAGTYTWQCMDPCGTGSDGWGGSMATTGYMRGTLTVV
jgi:hypothetical protein